MPKITKEEVESFLHGSNPMERIVKIECGYDDNKAAVYYRDENGKKQVQMDDFFPFCWAKQSAARRLYNGNRDRIKGKMAEYGISCCGLRTQKDDGTEPERMKNGYRVLFYANHPMTYQSFQRFFEEGGVPLSSRKKDGTIGEEERNYVTVSPNEQYMIWTGKRLFKGYEDYDELVRMQWDLETTGLDPQKDIIEQIGLRTNKGFEKIIPITGTTREERLKSQRDAMLEQYHIMREIDPDVMSGYNSENFDWYFEEEQWKKYGTTLQDASATELRFGAYKRKRESILKLGGEMERYRPTIVGSINITDGLHAVRRAMALDSNIKSATLKKISKDFNLKKPNRVYVPGLSISDIYNDNEEHYAFCETDGDWYLYQPNDDEEEESSFTLEYFQKLLDNDKEIVDEATGEILVERSYDENETAEHLLQLHTSKNKKNPSEGFKKGFDGNKFTMYKRSVLLDDYKLVSGRFIVERYLMDDLYETDAVELQFNQSNFQVGKLLPVSYERAATMGTAGIWKYIMLAWSFEHDLAIPEAENAKLEIGGLSRLMNVGWNGKLISDNDDEDEDNGGVYKFDYNSMYPTIEITNDYRVEEDITNVMITMLQYMLSTREKYKGEKKRWGKEADRLKESLEGETDKNKIAEIKNQITIAKRNKGKYDKLQLPFKITCNAWFGSVSSNVFYWNSANVGSHITGCGRQLFRLLIKHMQGLGYQPLVGDTDGLNFAAPDKFRYTKDNPYYCNGLGRNGKPGKVYTGAEADIQEFEDMYLRGMLGIEIDEVIPASIYIKRKNYLDLLDDGSVKMVGNSVKSKKMPVYIEKFLNNGVKLLLNGKGREFIESYYDYIDKIYNYKIPLRDIASVGKIKTSIEEYKKACKELTKGGTKKSRQAWYELVIKEGMSVDMGDTIYFINTGKKKSDSDVQRVTKYMRLINGIETDVSKQMNSEFEKIKRAAKGNPDAEKAWKEKYKNLGGYVKATYKDVYEKDVLNFSCVMLDRSIVEDEEDHFCDEGLEYNVEKYIEAFNKRISILFVCFDKTMRETLNEKGKVISNILISNPKDRKIFTDEQCKLVSGQPLNETDQDKVEDVLTMEDKELKFWTSIDEKPPYIDECGQDWEDVKKDYLDRMEVLKQEGVRDEVADFKRIIDNLKPEAIEAFIEEGELPEAIMNLCYLDTGSNNLMSKKYGVAIGTLYDIIDKTEGENDEDDE